jgi:hypothetical protein
MRNKSQLHNRKYCAKCLSLLGDKRIRDNLGNEFCDRDCLKDWWAENRKSEDELYGWWIGRD